MLIPILLAGCAGLDARREILIPVAAEVYAFVYDNVRDGVDSAVADGSLPKVAATAIMAEADALRAALVAGDTEEILAVDWDPLQAWAVKGVQRLVDKGEISPGVAASLVLRIHNFRDLLIQLAAREATP